MEVEEEKSLHPRNKNGSEHVAVVDEEGEEFLDINPMKKSCNYWKNEVVTYVEHETSPVFYLFLLFSMFAFGWTFLFLIPFAYLLLKNAVHRCSRCLNEIGTRHMFGLPDFSQEILIFQLGKCSVVISRTIGILVFTLVAAVFLYFSWFYDFGINHEALAMRKQSFQINNNWEEFIKDWGSDVVLSNSVKAQEIYKRKYEANIINWSGYFIEIKQTGGFNLLGNNNAYNILVKMEPSESAVEPDIALSISSSTYEQLKQTIESLYKGDQFNFSAKLLTLGDEYNIHHLHLLSLTKTGLSKQLPTIIVRESALPKDVPEDAGDMPTGST